VQVARAVGGQDDDRSPTGADRPDLRDGDLEIGQKLEQECLELVIGTIDHVDQQHRLAGIAVIDRSSRGRLRRNSEPNTSWKASAIAACRASTVRM